MNEQYDAFSHESTAISVRKIKSGPPLSWIVDAFRLVRAHWKTIIPAYLIVVVVSTLLQVVVGSLQPYHIGIGTMVVLVVVTFLAALLQSGMMAVFHGAAENRPRVSDVFRGFKGSNLLGMFLLFVSALVIFAVFALVMFLLMKLFGGSSMMGAMNSYGSPYGYSYTRMMAEMMGGSSLVVIFFLAGALMVTALLFYAVPQIIVSGESVFSALKNSFRATFKNLLLLLVFGVNAATLYALLLMVSMAGAALTTSMALIVVVMVVVISGFFLIFNGAYYLSFREVLLARPEAAKVENA
ncbi:MULTISPECIES: hypothetical protein [Halomonas]|uniref:Transmembrane protein n=1 Tax=Halomonas halophila TaxID=29573 RepID=A0ABQ0U7K2_9GAMM|nr:MULTISPECIES: hypothetical protein [Halomonas]MDR5889374.1 hypothetical protein [Halomonas salina]WJY06060.1 hypothetical protein QWG60_10100 [Halomonas halophila]GEK74499.1 hypothetical protein HHA04nite_30430 [Halomonas halophila]